MHLFSSSSRLKKMWEILLCLLSVRIPFLLTKQSPFWDEKNNWKWERLFSQFSNTVIFLCLKKKPRTQHMFQILWDIGKHLWIWPPQSCLRCQKFHARNHFSMLLLGMASSASKMVVSLLGWPLGSSRILIQQLALTSADTYRPILYGRCEWKIGIKPSFLGISAIKGIQEWVMALRKILQEKISMIGCTPRQSTYFFWLCTPTFFQPK